LERRRDDIRYYMNEIDKANTRIARVYAQNPDNYDFYRDAVLQRDVWVEAMRQRYPELKATAQWFGELGYDVPRFSYINERLGVNGEKGPKNLPDIRNWMDAQVKNRSFWSNPGATVEAMMAKWDNAYKTADPKLQPYMDEAERSDCWYAMIAYTDGRRKQLLEKGYTLGSDVGKAVIKQLDEKVYQKLRKASPAFAAEVDATFGKKDFLKYMLDPRRESTADIRKVKAEAAKLRDSSSLVSYAESLLGTPSKSYGPYSIESGLSCSAFTATVMAQAGVHLDSYTGAQYPRGKHVTGSNSSRGDVSDLRPGDLVFKVTGNSEFTDDYGFGHVALYIGNGRIIESNNGPRVSYGTLSSWTGPWEGRRYIK
jgi:cell wall-associated NlpC family hydrolase